MMQSEHLQTLQRRVYPLVVGMLLGVMQTGLFFQLTFTLASSFSTYLLVTLCWLGGSMLGVWWFRRVRVQLQSFLILMLAAYGLCAMLLLFAPFQSNLMPVYAILIVLTGVYPGVFFGRMSTQYSARDLFFMENNGFILGIVLMTIGFMLIGRFMLWGLPVILGIVLFAFSPPEQPYIFYE